MKQNTTFWIFLCIAAVLPIVTLGHSFNQDQVNRLEPISNINIEIAPRTKDFYIRRGQSANPELMPATFEYDDSLRLSLNAYNQTFYLHLEPNLDLFHPDAVIHHEGEESRKIIPAKDSIYVYKGHVMSSYHTDNRWLYQKAGVLQFDSEPSPRELGWARILIRHDSKSPVIEGAFRVKNDIYHIKSTTNYNLVKRSVDAEAAVDAPMVIYRESDTVQLSKRQLAADTNSSPHQCGFDDLLHPKQLVKRAADSLSLTNVQGCPTSRKINYMGAAADCTYVQYYKNVDNARTQIINNFNMASAVFEETFNISLGLINITIMDRTCPVQIDSKVAWNRACNASYSLGDRLSDFSLWRSNMQNDGAGLWHLMTNCATGVEVGLAWLKQLCNSHASAQLTSDGKEQFVSGAGVSAITRDEWKVVAHEIGHGFGAIHDCVADNCPCSGDSCQCCQLSANQCDSSGYLMSALSNSSAEHFSPCSINTICSAFPSIGTCLSDPAQHRHNVYQLNVCGNGIKEEGEECDTGGEDTACCDAKTCKLKENAVCEDSNQACCNKCQIRPKNDVCRPAATPCDIDEFCTGDSPECPVDEYLRDGISCGTGGLKCASGQCTSRDEQCLSRGYVLNITQSCVKNNEECKMLCQSPDSEKCLIFSGNFIDGTPCGFGGRCFMGECQNGGALGSSLLYLREHKNVAIPVGIVIFLVLCAFGFALFWFGCWRCTGYRKKRRSPRRKQQQQQHATDIAEYYNDSDDSLTTFALPEYVPSSDVKSPYRDEKRSSNNSTMGPSSPSSSTSSMTIVNQTSSNEKSSSKKSDEGYA